jgi:ribosomal protein S18 acetylase RimI-like enzyme
VKIRDRTDDDLDACIRLAQEVHERDAYPKYVLTNWEAFVATPGALRSWVADDDDGMIVGHVALHPRTTPAAVGLACEKLLVAPDALGVVARLFVAPAARRRGIAHALLETAAAEAHARDLQPMLDVGLYLTDAIALYDHAGWQRIGQVTHEFENGESLEELVYVAPDVTIRRRDWKQ